MKEVRRPSKGRWKLGQSATEGVCIVDTPKYNHRPLRHHDSIRLLRLHPSTEDDAPIVCSIFCTRLSATRSKYEALSYTWGAENPPQHVLCRNSASVLHITPNCYGALRRLRKKHADRVLWIDAISINQEDDLERTAQVRIMDRIFAEASRVIIDLGEETPGSRLLFAELIEADKSQSLAGFWGLLTRPKPSKEIVQELEALYRRPWFSRVWVLQEVALNDTIVVVCGSDLCSWEALMSCNFGFSSLHRITMADDPPVFRLKHLHRDQEYQSPIRALWRSLLFAHCLSASDSRDKVIALLSLSPMESQIKDALVDYSQDIEILFIKVAEILLSDIGLQLLTSARHGHNRDMPSWVPDWSQIYPLDVWILGDIEYDIVPRGKAFESKSLAIDEGLADSKGHTETQDFEPLSIKSQPRALRVSGDRLDVSVCQSATFSFTSFEDAKEQFMELLHVGRHRNSTKDMGTLLEKLRMPYELAVGKCAKLHFLFTS